MTILLRRIHSTMTHLALRGTDPSSSMQDIWTAAGQKCAVPSESGKVPAPVILSAARAIISPTNQVRGLH